MDTWLTITVCGILTMLAILTIFVIRKYTPTSHPKDYRLGCDSTTVVYVESLDSTYKLYVRRNRDNWRDWELIALGCRS